MNFWPFAKPHPKPSNTPMRYRDGQFAPSPCRVEEERRKRELHEKLRQEVIEEQLVRAVREAITQ